MNVNSNCGKNLAANISLDAISESMNNLLVAHEGAGDTVEGGEVALDEVHRVNSSFQSVHASFLAPALSFHTQIVVNDYNQSVCCAHGML